MRDPVFALIDRETSMFRYDPQYWRERAEEARAIAEFTANLEARQIMLDVAATYAATAERAEARMAAKPERPDDYRP